MNDSILKIFRHAKDYNIVTIDVWVFVFVYLTMFPASTTSSSLPTWYIDVTKSLAAISLIMSGLIIAVFVILCSKLRGYRYIDIYPGCKKISDKTLKYIKYVVLFIAGVFILSIPIIGILVLYPIVCGLIAILLSFSLNSSQNKQAGESK